MPKTEWLGEKKGWKIEENTKRFQHCDATQRNAPIDRDGNRDAERDTGNRCHLVFLFILFTESDFSSHFVCKMRQSKLQQHQWWKKKGKNYNGRQQQCGLQKSSHMHSFIWFTHLVAVLSFYHCSIFHLPTTMADYTRRKNVISLYLNTIAMKIVDSYYNSSYIQFVQL